MRRLSLRAPTFLAAAGTILGIATWTGEAPATDETVPVRASMICSRGPDKQYYEARVLIPPAAPAGSVFTVRIEAASSPKIAGIGLNYLHDFLTDYYLPEGTAYVEGSAHVVAGTGSDNVRAGARALFDSGFVRLHLPGHVDNGSTFTPPGLEFQLKVTAPPGVSLPVRWVRHRVTANVFLIGSLDISCTPAGGAYTLGTTVVTPPS